MWQAFIAVQGTATLSGSAGRWVQWPCLRIQARLWGI